MQDKGSIKKSINFFEPVDVASLVFFRVSFGLIMLWHVFRFWPTIESKYLLPIFHFKYYGFGWVKVPPGNGMYFLLGLLAVLALLITFGLFYRIVIILFFFGITYVFLLDQAYYLNHIYLVCLLSFLLIFIPCHRSFSLDALINPKMRSQFVPVWCLWLLRVQIGIVYFYAGIAKLNTDWMQGTPMKLWLAYLKSYSIFGQFFTEEWVGYLFSYGGLGFDLLIVPLLLFRKTRPIGYICAIMFHLMNAYIFDIGIFPWLMIAATLIFFSPSWPRQFLAAVQQRTLHLEEKVASMPEFSLAYRSLTTIFVTVFLSFQLLIPFRHHLYPGNAGWTDEGHRFAWRMLIRFKGGKSIFYVTDPKSHRTVKLKRSDILKFLTQRQYEKMINIPDMTLQFSHYLAERFKEKGYPDVEVRARVLVFLNERPPQLLIDPNVNLAKVKARVWPPAEWILPLNEDN